MIRPAILIVLPALALLCACNTTRGLKVPVPAPVVAAAPQTAPPRAAPAPKPAPNCVPQGLAKAPAYPDTDAKLKAAGEAAERYQLLAAGRLLRIRRLAELERIVAACRRAGT